MKLYKDANLFAVRIKGQELLTLSEHQGLSPGFGVVRDTHVFIFCAEFFALFVFVLCLVYPMLPVSMNCPFLIAPPVFFNVYLSLHVRCRNITNNIYDFLSIANNGHLVFPTMISYFMFSYLGDSEA